VADKDFTVTVQIAAPPATVWAVLSDLEAWPSWTTSMTSVRRTSSGPFTIGTAVRVKQPSMPELTWVVTDVVPAERFTWTSKSMGVTTVAHHILRPQDGGTEVSLVVEQSGLLAPLVALLLGKRGRRYVETEAAGLKRAAEAAV
jgi:uncharacterized protein YndB with AHSA1/START domain